ncbi:ribosomal protein S7 [Nesidiocoris tenuis]|uniref:Ribosomal protein S7 n=1 Tax=Nesidiocoris tenuis TaxID=355587 RepID=A0ABN7B5U6_9HEMI|nr:ribosomal protein S7 [Nesidiocoris tenuis]
MLRGRLLSVISARQMAMFGPEFKEPHFRKSELEELQKTGEISKIGHIPFKAAPSAATVSPLYDPLLEKFTNYVMRKGEKQLARDLMAKTLQSVKRIQVQKYNAAQTEEEKAEIEINAMKIFHKAVENCKPLLTLTPVKKGGATYQVPINITAEKASFTSMNWLIEAAKSPPKDARFYNKLAHELINAAAGTGKVIKRKQELHKQCEANRAYAHYRWG